MALTGLNLRCKLLARHIEDLADFLAIFLEAESQIEVGQLHLDGWRLGISRHFRRDFD